MNVTTTGIRCAGGLNFPGEGQWTMTYDPAMDTFSIDPEQWGGESVWRRVGRAG